ncbi:hypothetical protein [Sulfitobacter sp. S190]|uniref:hypothetical protein n=1 Tax=Sulfitobacter sp. S190 TaxID=2867022 RepID=UPI0021A455BF|nr:hypothetical protein [Sulfitobacter sp. S190]UWR21681.1 hypothetical protein K3756_13435 [Sulfitobacter sp. S190]
MSVTAQINTGWSQAAGMTPVCALQVFGMRRSGNHAIIDWLMRNAPEAATGGVFFNNCKVGANPVGGHASLDVYDADRRVIPPLSRPHAQRWAEAGQAPMTVVSYEDRMPVAKGPQKASRGFDDRDFDHRVVVFRSFLNWSASLLAKIKRNPDYGSATRMRVLMVAMATYRDGLKRLTENDALVPICYDDWMLSEDYRARVLRRLDLPARDLSRGEVQHFGGGSSFQGKKAKVSELQTTSRDMALADDPEYQLVLWTAAHDRDFVEHLMPHFPQDAERLVTLAETASLSITLPPREAQT